MLQLTDGEMRMQKEEGGEWSYAVLGKGFCMAANNRVTVLADTVERPEEVDVNRAKEASGACSGASSSEAEYSGVSYDAGCYGACIDTTERNRKICSIKLSMMAELLNKTSLWNVSHHRLVLLACKMIMNSRTKK